MARLLLLLLQQQLLVAVDGGGEARREVNLWVWSGGEGRCAGCALANASADSCELSPCADPAGAECVNGTSCAFLPKSVAQALKADRALSPFLTGVFVYLGYGVRAGSSGAMARPPKYALQRAAVIARSMRGLGIRYIPMVNGPGTIQQFRGVVANATAREAYVAQLVADARRFGFDGYSFDWELGEFSEKDTRDFATLLLELQRRFEDVGLMAMHVSAAVGGIGVYGMPGTAGYCDRAPCGGSGSEEEQCRWWNCSEVDPVQLAAGSNITVLTMNTYDRRDPCWYRYVAAINKTVPRNVRGIGLKADTASAASHDAVYMNPTALARRFAAIESSGIDQIGIYGGFTFNALDEYRPLLRAFLAGRGASRDWDWPTLTYPPMICN